MESKRAPRQIHEPKRKCGYRKEGGLYLVGEDAPDGTLPRWISIEPPIPYEGEHFRGFVYIDGNMIQDGHPMDTWLIGPSLDRAIKEVWTQLLGMPLKVRCSFGICQGAKTAEEVSACLQQQLTPVLHVEHYRRAVEETRRAIGAAGLTNTQADAAATELARAGYAHVPPADVLAHCWQVARHSLWDGTQNDAQKRIQENLARAMVCVNALEDAIALRRGEWLQAWRGQ